MDNSIFAQALGIEHHPLGKVPEFIEELIRKDKLNEKGLGDTFRRFYLASQERRKVLLAESGCASWDEYYLREQQREIDEHIHRMGIPSVLRHASFIGCKWTQAMRFALGWTDGPHSDGGCLVLSGRPGVGKSYAAVAIVKALLQRKRSVRWYYAGDMLADVYASQVKNADAATTPVLVIDDLGAEPAKEREKLDSLFYYRHGNSRATIITTNLRAADLSDRYGARIADRLTEWADIYEIGEQSLRGA